MNRRDFLAAAAALPLLARAAEGSAKYRVAVIGHTGRGDYGHGLDTMWLELPQTEIVAVADADAAGLAKAQERLRTNRGFADYAAMLHETKPDIVAICPRSADQHRDMVVAAAEAGVRGIYMEKPFGRTPQEADEMVAACEKANVKCAVAHRNRWHPALPAIKKFVDDGHIGKLLEIRTRGKEDDRGGAVDLWILGSHALNLATYYAGSPTACTATLLTEGRPAVPSDAREGNDAVGLVAGDEAHVRYEMESGIPVFFDSIRRAGVPAAGFGLQLIGTKAVIDIRVDQPAFAHVMEGNPFRPSEEPRKWTPFASIGVGQVEPPEVRAGIANHVTPGLDLIAAIEENRQPLCGVKDGAATVEMICAALASHRQGGSRLALPLKDRGQPLEGWA